MSICSMCGSELCTCACICQFPPTSLCTACFQTHQEQDSVHFAFPMDVLQFVCRENYLLWKEWMFALKRQLLLLMENVEAANTVKNMVKVSFEDAYAQIKNIENDIFTKIDDLITEISNLIPLIINEITEKCGLATPVFTHPLCSVIWTRAVSNQTSQIPLFNYNFERNEFKIGHFLGLKVEPGEWISPKNELNIPNLAPNRDKIDSEMRFFEIIEGYKDQEIDYKHRLDEQSRVIEELRSANEVLTMQALQCIVPLPKSQVARKSVLRPTKSCLLCRISIPDSDKLCENECICEECMAKGVVKWGKLECEVCGCEFNTEKVRECREKYAGCGGCGEVFRTLEGGKYCQRCETGV